MISPKLSVCVTRKNALHLDLFGNTPYQHLRACIKIGAVPYTKGYQDYDLDAARECYSIAAVIGTYMAEGNFAGVYTYLKGLEARQCPSFEWVGLVSCELFLEKFKELVPELCKSFDRKLEDYRSCRDLSMIWSNQE